MIGMESEHTKPESKMDLDYSGNIILLCGIKIMTTKDDLICAVMVYYCYYVIETTGLLDDFLNLFLATW